MSAAEKERIFVELREYHLTNREDFSSDQARQFAKQFLALEDQAVNMMLSFISGKEEFQDMSSDFETLKANLPKDLDHSSDQADKNYFISRIQKIEKILALAAKSSFKVRPQHYKGTSPRNTSGIITTQNK